MADLAATIAAPAATPVAEASASFLFVGYPKGLRGLFLIFSRLIFSSVRSARLVQTLRFFAIIFSFL